MTEQKVKCLENTSKEALNMALHAACALGDLNSVKYILTSKNLQEHGDVYSNNSLALELAFNNDQLHIMEYLIFEHKIEKNEILNNLMNIFPSENADKINNMFKVRNIKNQLTEELSSNNQDGKKIKI